MKPIVILRPEPTAAKTAARARSLGLEVRELPLFELAPLEWTAPEPDRFDGLLLTSANAVRCGGPELEKVKHLPVHAVGPATAEAAEAAGFTVASVGAGGRRGMIVPGGQRLLHIGGQDRIDMDRAEAVAVYESRFIDEPDVSGLEGCVVLVHSPRAGRRLAELVAERSKIAIAAISPAAAEACGEGWEQVEAATEPHDPVLLEVAARLSGAETA